MARNNTNPWESKRAGSVGTYFRGKNGGGNDETRFLGDRPGKQEFEVKNTNH